ncbi:unnamed protein product [Kuraishia capsulata CBS 1993]|uniref:Uncharacterized protein n=1 Tax=Kuraishia capsulata CBS 1993 TaxID=1382522 RepID=W6MQE0_9ASCO|nr:uncharacterized protein KUCA_T00004955001 [Kuraishia capsulata CBS 1993]CDK28969.1 unnamed protein product [Kuraishia capsulata CBS 1993]
MSGPECATLLGSSILSTRDINGLQGIDAVELRTALSEMHKLKSQSLIEGAEEYKEDYLSSSGDVKMMLSQVLDERLRRILDGSMRGSYTGVKFSEDLAQDLKQNSDSLSYIKLRVIIERAIADVHSILQRNGAELLSPHELLKLKQEKLRIEGLISCAEDLDHTELYRSLNEVNERLTNHNLLSTSMGQLSDPLFDGTTETVRGTIRFDNAESHTTSRSSVSAGNWDTQETNRALEDLLSLVMSLSIQKNIELSQPDPEILGSLSGKINWATNCVDEIMRSDLQFSPSSDQAPRRLKSVRNAYSDSEELLKLRTAVKDLNFSQKYLGRQFEDERAQYHQTISTLRKNLQGAQNLLVKSNSDLTQQANQVLNMELKLNEVESQLMSKKSELLQLTKEVNLLRVDSLGTFNAKALSPQQGPTTPTLPNFDSPNSPNKSNVSVSILKAEFKKLVTKINEKYESDLNAERTERMRLQELVKMYEKGGHSPRQK